MHGQRNDRYVWNSLIRLRYLVRLPPRIYRPRNKVRVMPTHTDLLIITNHVQILSNPSLYGTHQIHRMKT